MILISADYWSYIDILVFVTHKHQRRNCEASSGRHYTYQTVNSLHTIQLRVNKTTITREMTIGGQ